MSYRSDFSGDNVAIFRPSSASPQALERRQRHQQKVLGMGLTPEVLGEIVDVFYLRVRAHPILAPLFADPIGDRWEAHLATMKSFWQSVALNLGTYSGKPVVVHERLADVRPWHFGIWLGLFRETVLDVTGSAQAVNFLAGRATRIANTLARSMFPDEEDGDVRFARHPYQESPDNHGKETS